jgi:hypothetical protein
MAGKKLSKNNQKGKITKIMCNLCGKELHISYVVNPRKSVSGYWKFPKPLKTRMCCNVV